jgi:Holliday junction resolvase RusA-like endonuclease
VFIRMSECYRIMVPVVPDGACGQNHRGHWREKAKAVRTLRLAAKMAAIEHRPLVALTGDVEVRAVICWPRGRKRMDPSNAAAALKGAVDGLTDAGMWLDDNRVQVRVDEQRTWGEWGAEAGHHYPGGVVTFDIRQSEPPRS